MSLAKPVSKKLSPARAIDEHCFDCGWDSGAEGSKHQQIEWCKDTNCNLWEHRPVTGKAKAEIKQAKYNAMSDSEKAKYDAKSKMLAENMARIRK